MTSKAPRANVRDPGHSATESEPRDSRLRSAREAIGPLLLLVTICVAVYANNFRHEFFLDDAHALVGNLSIRRLANIPRFFTDAGMFSNLSANVDYRPVLLISFAANYWMGAYDTTWWHATQILLHAVCTVGLFFLARRVIGLMPADRRDAPQWIFVPVLAAAVFAAHPTASGVINYLSARSSLLTASLVLPSIVLYMVPHDDPRYARTPVLSPLLFGLALFTKVEAIGAFAVYALYEVWMTARTRHHRFNVLQDALATFRLSALRRLWPYVVMAVCYFAVRAHVMAPFQLDQSRHSADVGPLQYLLTQTVVWWVYVRNWFAPFWLVADQPNFPVYRTLLAGPALAAITAWLLVAIALVWSWRSRPWLLFLALAGLALLSPTSSIAPLAEMLNEHRPYLPLGVLSLLWMIPLGLLIVRRGTPPRRIPASAWVVMAAMVGGCGTLTWQRNHAFSTNRAYLEDIVAKAPAHRPLNNYALIFMSRGEYPQALALLTRALQYAPQWYSTHINLGVVYREMGDAARSREHFDLAVQYDQFSSTARVWRGEDFLARRDYGSALADFTRAKENSLDAYALCRGLATAFAGLGDVAAALRETQTCLTLDGPRTAIDIVKIAKPFFDEPTLTGNGVQYFDHLSRVIPNTWWVHANLGTLTARLGDGPRAQAESARAQMLRSRAAQPSR